MSAPAVSGARSAARQAAYLLKFGASVYLFRDYVCEPTVVSTGEGALGKEKTGACPTPHPDLSPPPSPPPLQCVGPSMLPTLNARGDIVLIESLSRRAGRIRVGDVVVAASPTNPRHAVCKRVRGLGGDTVPVGEPAPGLLAGEGGGERARGGGAPAGVVVPRGHVWLEGDNAANSTDSRAYGPVPLALVRGRVFAKVWPPWDGTAGWVGRERVEWREQRFSRRGGPPGRPSA